MKTKFEKIAEAIANKRQDLFNSRAYEQVTDAIYYAWTHWDGGILKGYYEGEKPEHPTWEFCKMWVENELDNIPEQYETLIEGFKG